MSEQPPAPGWWQASDDRWYPPESHPDYVPPVAAPASLAPPASRRSRSLLIGAGLLAVVVALGLGWSAFGRDDGSSLSGPQLISPREVVSLMRSKGYDCNGYEAQETEDVIEYRNAAGTCTHGPVAVNVDTFKDAKHLDAHLKLMHGAGCQIAKSIGMSGEYNLVVGRYYAIFLDDQLDTDAARALAKQIGGRLERGTC